jgi:hypothetical protein
MKYKKDLDDQKANIKRNALLGPIMIETESPHKISVVVNR